MRRVTVFPAGGMPPARADRFVAPLAELRTLGDVLAWLRAQQPARAVAEIVTQDEYTHDVLVGWDAETWLVFDTS